MATATQTVREIALEQPTSIRVFERFGIDYCCGGRKPLTEACAAIQIEPADLLAELQQAAATPAQDAVNWSLRPLGHLIGHIVATHHAYIRTEMPRLALLADKVVSRHGPTHPEVSSVRTSLSALYSELIPHLEKEEQILFPYLAELEKALKNGASRPYACFGTVESPIAMMTAEHEAAGELMSRMRKLSNGFAPPDGACPTYHAFYLGLNELEQDIHRHIHLENNILFPRAIVLEARGVASS